MRKLAIVATVAASAICALLPGEAMGFCGFYVAGADTELYNNATMVTLMRDGTTTVLSMSNNYQGPPEDFAMVVPVPVVLEKANVKTLTKDVFGRVDKLAAPRLVEYWEQDPCPVPRPDDFGAVRASGALGTGSGFGKGGGGTGEAPLVVVEAEFVVGEYEIVILSARDATALETWITSNGYQIPSGAAPYFRPYIEEGWKFFVAKVNPKKVTFKDGMADLSPLRFHYDSKDFRLPVRLGLINAKDKQDLIVHILAKDQRYEVANYPNVTVPTNLIVDDAVRDRFGEFYAALFDATREKQPGAVVTEYSWSSSSCDPCPEPPLTQQELTTLGLDVLSGAKSGTGAKAPVPVRRVPQIRIGQAEVFGDLDKNIIRRYVRRHLPRIRFCYEKELQRKPNLAGTAVVDWVISTTGSVQSVKVTGLGDKTVEQCIATAIKAIQFPSPKGGGIIKVKYPLRLSSAPQGGGLGLGQFGPRENWVLTRLHTRYDQKSLGEDLVFRAAQPIRGGQGGGGDDLVKTAESAPLNTFQGRYIIRHEWTGPMACESPQRGIWGGPPAGVKGSSSPVPATNLAFVPRGRVALAAMVRESIPGLPTPEPPANQAADGSPATGAAGSGTAPPAAEPDKPSSSDKDRGCSVSSGGFGAGGLILVAAIGMVIVRRRRR